jgi:simple sugar transport system permease protein
MSVATTDPVEDAGGDADRAEGEQQPRGRLLGEVLRFGRERRLSVVAQLAVFVLFLCVGLAVGIVFSWATGHSPSVVMSDLWDGSVGSRTALTYTMQATAPLLLVAAGTVVCMRAGQFNIGQEGQVTMGAVGAGFVVLNMDGPGGLIIPLAFVSAFVFGGIWAGATAVLKFIRHVNIVVSSLLSVFLAEQLMIWMISDTGPLHDTTGGALGAAVAAQSAPIPGRTKLPTLHVGGLDIPSSFVVAVVAAILVMWALRSSLAGYRLRILGESPVVARTVGISEARLGSAAVIVSGGFAGMAGAVILLGQSFQIHSGLSSNIGWNGLLIALAARTKAGVAIVVAVVFGALTAGGGLLGTDNVPSDLVNVIIASVVVALLCPPVLLAAIRRYRVHRAAKAT